MKGKYIHLIAILITSSVAAFGASESPFQQSFIDKRPVITSTSLQFGAYDPHGDFRNDKNSSIEHIFLPWEDVDLSTLDTADRYALELKRTLLKTVEPWSWLTGNHAITPQKLAKGIVDDHYDKNMAAICTKTATLKSPVIIRWAQEMEDDSGHFLWSRWNPEQFISTYRHVVSLCRKYDQHARFMWSPKGEPGTEAYYPGSEYVDLIGLSLFGLQKRDRDEVGRDRSFAEMFAPLYQRVASFNKPVFIAELGYDGDATYVRNWALTVAQPNPAYPLLKAVVYFDSHEVYPWPKGYGLPNWRVTQNYSVK
jgi:beta-mannanase